MTHATNSRFCWRFLPRLLVVLLAAVLSQGSCSKFRNADLTPLDKAGVWFSDIEPLRALNISDAEVQEVVVARQGGLSDQACLDMVRTAHTRNQPFVDGNAAASLIRAGMQEDTVVELARLDQLGPHAGEIQAMRLAHLSDRVILAIAMRRAAGQPSLSGPGAAALQNIGFTQEQILAQISSGTTDPEANAIVARRNAAAASSGFVRQPRRRR